MAYQDLLNTYRSAGGKTYEEAVAAAVAQHPELQGMTLDQLRTPRMIDNGEGGSYTQGPSPLESIGFVNQVQLPDGTYASMGPSGEIGQYMDLQQPGSQRQPDLRTTYADGTISDALTDQRSSWVRFRDDGLPFVAAPIIASIVVPAIASAVGVAAPATSAAEVASAQTAFTTTGSNLALGGGELGSTAAGAAMADMGTTAGAAAATTGTGTGMTIEEIMRNTFNPGTGELVRQGLEDGAYSKLGTPSAIDAAVNAGSNAIGIPSVGLPQGPVGNTDTLAPDFNRPGTTTPPGSTAPPGTDPTKPPTSTAPGNTSPGFGGGLDLMSLMKALSGVLGMYQQGNLADDLNKRVDQATPYKQYYEDKLKTSYDDPNSYFTGGDFKAGLDTTMEAAMRRDSALGGNANPSSRLVDIMKGYTLPQMNQYRTGLANTVGQNQNTYTAMNSLYKDASMAENSQYNQLLQGFMQAIGNYNKGSTGSTTPGTSGTGGSLDDFLRNLFGGNGGSGPTTGGGELGGPNNPPKIFIHEQPSLDYWNTAASAAVPTAY